MEIFLQVYIYKSVLMRKLRKPTRMIKMATPQKRLAHFLLLKTMEKFTKKTFPVRNAKLSSAFLIRLRC